MKASEVTFQHLLNGKLQYRVPLFQRTYSWEKDQWKKLWYDIMEIYHMPTPQRHFMGSVVTQPIPDAPERATKHMLIDGQQRMTTLLLLLAVIRFHAEKNEKDSHLANEIEESCLKNAFIDDASEERLKLRPTRRDSAAFEQAMMGYEPGKSSAIGQAWAWFSEKISNGDREEGSINLRRLMERITLYLDLVSIMLETDDSPNRIFESLNDKGLRLEAADLVRNYLFMRIPPEQQDDAYDRIWFPMQERLKEAIDDFFWRYSMKGGDLTARDDIFNDTRQKLVDLPDTQMIPVLRNFATFSEYYTRIKWPKQHERHPAIRLQLERLNDWQVDVTYPLLLGLLNMQAQAQISDDKVVEILRIIESFVVRRTICGIPTNRLRRIFAGAAVQIRDRDDIASSLRTYLIGENWPSDDQFRDGILKFRLYNPARLARTRLILDSLELSFDSKEPPDLDNPIIWVEHVMPQTLTQDWMEALGPDSQTVYESWLDTVGNLTLTGYNPELSNKIFSAKKSLLESSSNFQLTKHAEDGVLRYDAWHEDTIRQRGLRLAQRALKIWPQ